MPEVPLVDATVVDRAGPYADELGPEGLSLDIIAAGTAVAKVSTGAAVKTTDGW